MTNSTIYVATIKKVCDYSEDLMVDCKAFSTYDKAVAFLTSCGLVSSVFVGWEDPKNMDITGEITELAVN